MITIEIRIEYRHNDVQKKKNTNIMVPVLSTSINKLICYWPAYWSEVTSFEIYKICMYAHHEINFESMCISIKP